MTSRCAPQRVRAQCIRLPHALTSAFAGRLICRPLPSRPAAAHPQGGSDHRLQPLGRALPAARPARHRRPPCGGGERRVECTMPQHGLHGAAVSHAARAALFSKPVRPSTSCCALDAPAGGALLGGGAAVHPRACAAGAGRKAFHLHARWLLPSPLLVPRLHALFKWSLVFTAVVPPHPICPLHIAPTPQRDVEVEVSSVDRAGNFQGTLRVGKLNLGGARLSACWHAVLPT